MEKVIPAKRAMLLGVLTGALLVPMLACRVPTPSGYAEQVAAFRGRSVNEAIRRFGAPKMTTNMAQGHVLYTWEDKSDMHTTKKIVPQRDAEGREYLEVQGGKRVAFDCTTRVEADAAGVVVWTETEGMGCLGLAPEGPDTSASGTNSAVSPAVRLSTGTVAPSAVEAPSSEGAASRSAGPVAPAPLVEPATERAVTNKVKPESRKGRVGKRRP